MTTHISFTVTFPQINIIKSDLMFINIKSFHNVDKFVDEISKKCRNKN